MAVDSDPVVEMVDEMVVGLVDEEVVGLVGKLVLEGAVEPAAGMPAGVEVGLGDPLVGGCFHD